MSEKARQELHEVRESVTLTLMQWKGVAEDRATARIVGIIERRIEEAKNKLDGGVYHLSYAVIDILGDLLAEVKEAP